MPLPTIFASVSAAQGVQLDQNFNALGALTAIVCAAAGTNAITLTPAANTPTIAAYANYQPFSFTPAGANTGATTARIGSLAVLNVYKDTGSGPTALSGGEIAAGNLIVLTYDAALNSGAGGFHLNFSGTFTSTPNSSATSNITATSGTTLTASVLTGGGTGNAIITRTGTISAGYNDATDTAAAIVGAMPNASANSVFRFRYINTTTQTGTLTAGSGVTVNATNNTTANGATHDFLGVITNTGTPAVTIYG